METKICSKNGWFTPAEAKNYYGRYSREGITVHWWGNNEPASAHDSIVNYFLAQAQQGIKSVNYVVSDLKITKMVEPDNVAWASQNGNPTTISIEFQPTLSDQGYRNGGQLIAQLEKQYGRKLTLYPHSHWFSTSCPGTINIARLRAEADKGGTVSDKVTTAELPDMVRGYLFREPRDADNVHLGKTWQQAQFDFIHSPQRGDAQKKFDNFPSKTEVEEAFKLYQPWKPINSPDTPNQTQYYTTRSRDLLYKDLIAGLKARLDTGGDAFEQVGTIDGKPIYRKKA